MLLRRANAAEGSTKDATGYKTVDSKCKVQSIKRGWTEKVFTKFKRYVSYQVKHSLNMLVEDFSGLWESFCFINQQEREGGGLWY